MSGIIRKNKLAGLFMNIWESRKNMSGLPYGMISWRRGNRKHWRKIRAKNKMENIGNQNIVVLF